MNKYMGVQSISETKKMAENKNFIKYWRYII